MTTLMALVLVLRVFDRSGSVPADRQAAIQAADSILRQADISATWVDCSRGSTSVTQPPCTDPLKAGELAIRITAGPAEKERREQRALGYSLVEPSVGGTLATVFSDRVAWLASSSGVAYTGLLGRAVAHEIGHLLIGTNEHSPSGLMRAFWTSAELARDERTDWLFTTDDHTRLRRSRLGQELTRLAEASQDAPKDES